MPRMYVDGTFKSIGLITLTTNYVDGFASAILSDQAQADLKETGHAITNFEFGSGVRMHVIATRDNGGVRLLIRPFE